MTLRLEHDRGAQWLMRLEPETDFRAAQARLERAALAVSFGDDAAHPSLQAALMALVRCGGKMFRGGVHLMDGPDPAWAAAPGAPSLRRMLRTAGAGVTPPPHALRVHVGADAPVDAALTAWTDGWDACVAPVGVGGAPGNEVSGALAGALLVSESFRRVVLGDLLAGRRRQRLSVWGPGAPADAGLQWLPKALWLLGLGNLGQATLFVLSLLPFADPSEVRLLLQDADRAGPENVPVQLLTDATWVGLPKVRQAAAWAEARGFTTVVSERRFSEHTWPGSDEPRVLLAGVDNLDARRWAAAAGLDLVLDAGLGAKPPEAFDLRLHAFPGRRTPEQAWPPVEPDAPEGLPLALAAAVAAGEIDQCGAMTIAGQSVGVPCTALAAAALQVGQLCRAIATRRCADLVDLSLRDPGEVAVNLMTEDLPDLAFVAAAQARMRPV
jgi:hypothetical protein